MTCSHLSTEHTSYVPACACNKRIAPFVALIFLLVLVLYSILSTTVETSDDGWFIPNDNEGWRTCVLPGSYIPSSKGACILTADNRVHLLPGVPTPPNVPWNEGECRATMNRFAPWLEPTRREFTAAPKLQCSAHDSTRDNLVLYAIEKWNTTYVVTEPVWTNMSVVSSAAPAAARNSSGRGNADECPHLYFTIHSLLIGQTFNQIQSIVSALWLSKMFKRTFVLPLLAIAGGGAANVTDLKGEYRTAFERYFSVDKLRQAGYCIVNYRTFEADIRRRYPKETDRTLVFYENMSLSNYGEMFQNGVINVAPLVAPPAKSIEPLKFKARFGHLIDALHVDDAPPDELPTEPVVMLENAVGFRVRAPFAEYIEILGLLEPSTQMAEALDEIAILYKKHTVGMHLRYREGFCRSGGEVGSFYRHLRKPTKESPLRFERSFFGNMSIMDECEYTAEKALRMVEIAMRDILPPIINGSTQGTPIKPSDVVVMLATDYQRSDEINKLADESSERNISLYRSAGMENGRGYTTDFERKVFGVVFDFFMLSRADVFFGNTMSSISQCVCLARLGQGRSCNGVLAGYIRGLLYPDLLHV